MTSTFFFSQRVKFLNSKIFRSDEEAIAATMKWFNEQKEELYDLKNTKRNKTGEVRVLIMEEYMSKNCVFIQINI